MSVLELSGVFVGTFLLVTGIFFIIMAAKKWVDSTTKYYLMGVFFILFGLGPHGLIFSL